MNSEVYNVVGNWESSPWEHHKENFSLYIQFIPNVPDLPEHHHQSSNEKPVYNNEWVCIDCDIDAAFVI